MKETVLKLTAVLFPLALLAFFSAAAIAQERDTVLDEAGVLSNAGEREVQQAFDEAAEATGDPLYAFLVPDQNVAEGEARRDLLRQEAEEEGAPDDAGVLLVAPEDGWALVSPEVEDARAVFETMRPEFRGGDYAQGLVAGAEYVADDASAVPEALTGGGVLLVLAVLVGGVLFAKRRACEMRELKRKRREAEEEFAALGTRMREFDEKESLVSGYLQAQRRLLDRRTEEEVESLIGEAASAGFGIELNEAANLLSSRPDAAAEKMRRGGELLDAALDRLNRAERTIDGYCKAGAESGSGRGSQKPPKG